VRALLGVMLLAGTAHADVDWAKGLVTAQGVGIADRHAPNPAVARGTSRRAAEDAAKAQLAKSVGALPVAGGGTVATKAKDPAVKARIDRAVAQAISVAAQPETDGAWTVTMAVPIEALRQALAGGPRDTAGDDPKAPAVVIVDGVAAKPTIGWAKAAAIWVKDVPVWAKDAPHVQADAAGTVGTAATLYVIATP
jgi:hypothetical protein